MPVNIHGKSYSTVAERIKEAGKDLIDVQTEVLTHEPVVIKATIKTSKGTFTGISAANASKQIEKENPYEVAETSAVGRALAFAGYATTDAIASVEEMKKAGVTAVIVQPEAKRMEFKDSKCPKCGSPINISKSTGKPYCSALCWKNPAPTNVAKAASNGQDYPEIQIPDDMPF